LTAGTGWKDVDDLLEQAATVYQANYLVAAAATARAALELAIGHAALAANSKKSYGDNPDWRLAKRMTKLLDHLSPAKTPNTPVDYSTACACLNLMRQKGNDAVHTATVTDLSGLEVALRELPKALNWLHQATT